MVRARARARVRARARARPMARASEGAPSQDLPPLVEASLLAELAYPDQRQGWG